MSVFLTELRVLERMGEIEGFSWTVNQHTDPNSHFNELRRKWEEIYSGMDLDPSEQEEVISRSSGESSIYGVGGVFRWFILKSGEVVFSEYHCKNPETLNKVQELGFRLW